MKNAHFAKFQDGSIDSNFCNFCQKIIEFLRNFGEKSVVVAGVISNEKIPAKADKICKTEVKIFENILHTLNSILEDLSEKTGYFESLRRDYSAEGACSALRRSTGRRWRRASTWTASRGASASRGSTERGFGPGGPGYK